MKIPVDTARWLLVSILDGLDSDDWQQLWPLACVHFEIPDKAQQHPDLDKESYLSDLFCEHWSANPGTNEGVAKLWRFLVGPCVLRDDDLTTLDTFVHNALPRIAAGIRSSFELEMAR